MTRLLELGRAGSAGMPKGVLPVLQDGAVVAGLHASNWKEAATAVIGDRAWAFAKQKGTLTGRWGSEPEGAVRVSARQTSWWKGTWALDLEGTAVDVEKSSVWKGTHRYLVAGRPVAESGTTGGWSPRSTLSADGSLPLDHQVFLLWVELVITRRNTGATTAAIGGGAVAGGSS
jgi:hypothetical protein